MAEPALKTGGIEALAGKLRHPDDGQLWFQLVETVTKRTYLQHGVEVRPGDLVLDAGANIGVAAAFFADECGAGTVHSFEPVPPIYELLEENMRGFPACVPHPYGLAAKPGRAPITYYPNAAAMSGLYADPDRDREQVRTYLANTGAPDEDVERTLEGLHDAVELSCELRTLSDAIAEHSIERVDLLKIDVERAEIDVLDGIGNPDWPRIRQVVVEVHDEGGRAARAAELLEERGFGVVTAQEPEWRGTVLKMLYATRS